MNQRGATDTITSVAELCSRGLPGRRPGCGETASDKTKRDSGKRQRKSGRQKANRRRDIEDETQTKDIRQSRERERKQREVIDSDSMANFWTLINLDHLSTVYPIKVES